jgi:hypothetical protein
MKQLIATAAAVVLLPVTADIAEAHAFGARYDLPLPLGLYLAAAGAAVAASFFGAMVFLRSERTRTLEIDLPVPAWLAGAVTGTLGALGVFVLALLLGAAFLGAQEAVRNLATVGIWVIWWVGFLLLSALAVGLWPAVDPFRTVAGIAARALGRPWAGRESLPPAVGLLAPVGLLAIAWVELVSDWSEDPAAVGVLVSIYLGVSILGGLAFGMTWFRVADPLGRIFAVLGRMAPIAAPDRATLRLRPPGEGLLDQDERPLGEAALITCLIGVVLFDGLSETPAWAAVLEFVSESQTLRPTLLWMREEGADLLKVIRTIGLFTTIATFYGTYWLLVVSMKLLVGGPRGIGQLARDFAGTLLPIAVAYHLSHYVSYLLMAGQLVFPAATDPFAMGWDLFGTRGWSIDVTVIGAEQIWWIAFVALIIGHALSVLIGHRRALQVFGNPRNAAVSQIPMMFAMVGLTVLSLWILSQPITE